MVTKADLHLLIDAMPDEAADEAARRLHDLSDPVLHKLLTAPFDDESEGEEEAAGVAAGREAIRYGKVITDEDLARELGL
jgi:hypothetical protein